MSTIGQRAIIYATYGWFFHRDVPKLLIEFELDCFQFICYHTYEGLDKHSY